MNLSALKTELLTLLSNTTNLTATEKQKLRDRAVLLYASDYQVYLTRNALTDTANNRSKFFIEKTVGNPPGNVSGLWSDIFLLGSRRENENALPPAETF